MADSYEYDSYQSIVSPYREVEFYQQVEQILEKHQVDKNAQDWILASIPSWDDIEELKSCQKLPPDKTEAVSDDLREVMDRFFSIKKALTGDFSIIGLSPESVFVSDVISNMFKGSRHLENFLLSDEEAKKWFLKADVEKLIFNIFKQHLTRRTPSYVRDSVMVDPVESFEPSAPTFSMLDLSSLGPLRGFTPPASIQSKIKFRAQNRHTYALTHDIIFCEV
ncbi:uncharacterized protein LOC142354800 [Convolutriloba macropyga]|uniref:uncharacterized protein LOC142354800 n=1 Tax=Convolutriloba macropyga TaxID=536237 RepID=UPI003F523F31